MPPEAAPAPASQALSQDFELTPDFVAQVEGAIESRNADEAVRLVSDLHPADTADLMGLLIDSDRRVLLEFLGEDLDPLVLPELEEDVRESVVEALDTGRIADAVSELESDDAAFVIEDLEEEKRAEVLRAVPAADRMAMEAAFEYDEDAAGRIMQREVFAAPAYWTIGQIIDHLRGAGEDLPDRFYEVFVVDPTYRPVGSIPLSTVLKRPREDVISELMTPEHHVIPDRMDQEEVAYLFEQYNLISAPVVDEHERLVGMITVDDIVEIVHEETHEDMLALGGVREEGLTDSVITTVRSRFSWLLVNLGTAILASVVIGFFGGSIEEMVALAILMPIIASMGGNAGTQTLTVAVRALATKDLTPANATRIVLREALVGGVNGVIFAVLMGGIAGLWFQNPLLGGVVAGAMVVNLLFAGLAGILIPLALQRSGADPAVASTVFVTTVTDVLGFLVFLGLGAVALT